METKMKTDIASSSGAAVKIDVSKLEVSAGRPYPTGPIVSEGGIRFTIFSRHATRVWLAVFENIEDRAPVWEYEYDPKANRIGDMWSIFVRGLTEGVYYMFRMDGPHNPKLGHRYNPSVYLLDPYAKSFAGDVHDGTLKCVTVHDEMDWPSDFGPKTKMEDTIIYETHVRGLTVHESANVENGGTYRGLIAKIPYLKELGVTAVELLPIQEFGETYIGRTSMETGEELTNYWGYSSIGFFAPAGRYACSAMRREHLDEFREMVHALHEANIEVILDVVFNHTSEGNEKGPTLCFRGIDNVIYYLLDDHGYMNHSGCGNTVNCNHPLVRDFFLDCLRYWVAVMHVDGFRFDLASILGRDQDGNVLSDAPLIKRIAEDPVLRDIKLIAEAWDAGGAYQVGSFGGARWAEWNGRYRDDVRRYWRGDAGTRATFASRIMGSADLYAWSGRTTEHSINFITCHDGFTLRDLVSYREKRNWANGEANRDGEQHNISFNCGAEGEVAFAHEVYVLRIQMQKNFLATLFLSLGVPMLLGGDEFGRTQHGNNNAYCQDNEISWYDWSLLDTYSELHRFCKALTAFRKENPALRRDTYFSGQPENGPDSIPDLAWFPPEDEEELDWSAPDTPIACRIDGSANGGVPLFIAFNNTEDPVEFILPEEPWRRRIDTAELTPNDILEKEKAPLLATTTLTVVERLRGLWGRPYGWPAIHMAKWDEQAPFRKELS